MNESNTDIPYQVDEAIKYITFNVDPLKLLPYVKKLLVKVTPEIHSEYLAQFHL